MYIKFILLYNLYIRLFIKRKKENFWCTFPCNCKAHANSQWVVFYVIYISFTKYCHCTLKIHYAIPHLLFSHLHQQCGLDKTKAKSTVKFSKPSVPTGLREFGEQNHCFKSYLKHYISKFARSTTLFQIPIFVIEQT